MVKVKDKLALEIKKIVEKNNASFAFPSTSVYVEKKLMKSVLFYLIILSLCMFGFYS